MTPTSLFETSALDEAIADNTLEALYPDSDGKPMAESTLQYQWIVYIKENLERLFVGMLEVFIAADLLWYPIKVKPSELPKESAEAEDGSLRIRVPQEAPDVMVVFGRPKGHRRSYRQWQEGNVAPQVVFEILSASNKTKAGMEAMDEKLAFYERHGVEEYYIYDPDERVLEAYIRDVRRDNDRLIPLGDRDLERWVSPRLQVRFEWRAGQVLGLFYPSGLPFRSFVELGEFADFQESQAKMAQGEAARAAQRAEEAEQRATQEAQRANQAEEQARAQMRLIAQNLRSTGLAVEAIAPILGLSEESVQGLLDAQG